MMTGGWLLTAAVLAVTSSTLAVQLPSYLYRQSGRDSPLKIRPKPCINARGLRGQCMFVWDCIKGEGEHLGTCVDGFLFGSCCGHDVHHNVLGDKSKPTTTTSTTTIWSWSSSSSSSYPSPTPELENVGEIEVLRDDAVTNISGVVVDSGVRTPTPVISSLSATLHMTTGEIDGSSALSLHGANNSNAPELTTATMTSPATTTNPPVALPLPLALSSTIAAAATVTSRRPLSTTTTVIPTATMAPITDTTTTPPTTTSIATSRTTSVVPPTTTTPTEAASTTSTMERRTMEAIEAPIVVPSKVFQDCGTSAMLPQMRIVGGKDSRFGAWPWQVSVRRSTYFGFSSTHRCGGAVLNENWIATAGHCVADLLLAQIRIRVGEYDLSSSDEPQPFIERSVQKKVVHPKYNPDTYEHDLALVRLDKPLVPAENVGPICLPAGDPLLVGDSATITGWGRLKEGGTLPSVLQEVRVPIVSNKKCEQMFLATGRREKIPNFFICAGFEKGGKDSCQGDSGGPLQLKSQDGRWVLAGIISWGIGCGEPNLPGVCTRISKFREWILNKIDKEGA